MRAGRRHRRALFNGVVAHPASDITDQVTQSMQRYEKQSLVPLKARTHAGVCRFFNGLDWSSPAWCTRTGGGPEQWSGTGRDLANYGGTWRKP